MFTTIDGWYKEFQLNKSQMDKLHKLVEKGVVDIDFEKILYTWEKVEEMLSKPLPLEKKTIYSWWLDKDISDEDYFLLKKKGIDVDNEKLTQKEVWDLVNEYEAEPTVSEEKHTLESWKDKGVIDEEQYQLLSSIVDPNQEFTSQEIINKLFEETQKEKNQLPNLNQPRSKLFSNDLEKVKLWMKITLC